MSGNDIRICTISEGLEAVLRLAGLISGLQGVASRTDYQFSEALEHLGGSGAEGFDLVIVAPFLGGRSHDMLLAILEKACGSGSEVLLLLPEGEAVPAGVPEAVHVLEGPPFPKGRREALLAAARNPASARVAAGPAEGRAGLGGILGRLRRPGGRPGRLGETGEGGTSSPDRDRIETIVVQGTCGGAGATTVATNLAAELAAQSAGKPDSPAVCLLDLNLQFGSVAAYLSLPGNSRISDAYRNLSRLDAEAFRACLQPAGPGLQVFAAPTEVVPMDALGAAGFERLLNSALAVAPHVVIDMPPVLTEWSEQAFRIADRVLCVSVMEVRAARNARYLGRVLNAVGLPPERLRHTLNRVPQRRGQAARDWALRLASFEKGIGARFALQLPDGGAAISEACDMGAPLREACPRNPLAQEFRRLAAGIPAIREDARERAHG